MRNGIRFQIREKKQKREAYEGATALLMKYPDEYDEDDFPELRAQWVVLFRRARDGIILAVKECNSHIHAINTEAKAKRDDAYLTECLRLHGRKPEDIAGDEYRRARKIAAAKSGEPFEAAVIPPS